MIYKRNTGFTVDKSIYKKNKQRSFVLNMSIREKKSSEQQSHLYMCNTENDYFTQMGKKAIIPICNPCSKFESEVKIKKLLQEKKMVIRYQNYSNVGCCYKSIFRNLVQNQRNCASTCRSGGCRYHFYTKL